MATATERKQERAEKMADAVRALVEQVRDDEDFRQEVCTEYARRLTTVQVREWAERA